MAVACGLAAERDATTLARLAAELHAADDYAGMVALLAPALADTASTRTVESAVLLNNLGGAYHHLGEHRLAERAYRRALDIYGRLVSVNDPLRIRCTSNLAELYLDLGETAKAEALRPVMLQQLGGVDPSTPAFEQLLVVLAAQAVTLRRYAEAEALYERALKVRPGANSHSMQVRNNLGTLYMRTGRPEAARRMCEEALAICETVCEPVDRRRALLLLNFADLRLHMEGPAAAEGSLARSLAEAEAALSADDPVLAQILSRYADVLRKLKKKELAKELANRARSIRDRAAIANAWRRHTVDARDLSPK